MSRTGASKTFFWTSGAGAPPKRRPFGTWQQYLAVPEDDLIVASRDTQNIAVAESHWLCMAIHCVYYVHIQDRFSFGSCVIFASDALVPLMSVGTPSFLAHIRTLKLQLPFQNHFRSSGARWLLCGQAVLDEVDDEKAAQAFINPTTAAGGMPLRLSFPEAHNATRERTLMCKSADHADIWHTAGRPQLQSACLHDWKLLHHDK